MAGALGGISRNRYPHDREVFSCRPSNACRWILLLLVVLSVPPMAAFAQAEEGPQTLEQLRAARREAAQRQRRVILNNDGCDVLYFPAGREVTPENLLELRTSPLIGSHVDSIFYCTISSGFGYFTHNTRAGSVLDADVARHFGRGDMNATRPLIEQGTDALQVMVEFCRANGLEIFWSMRMNDTHDGAHRPEQPYPLFSPLKQQHPEYLIGAVDRRPKHGAWTAVDYTHAEIRRLALSYLEEVCQNYDVDGIELDFFRHLSYFKSVALGGQATREELGMMTDLLRQVREMTEREGLRRGRPILVAVRVPDSVDYCRGLGLDLERWLAEGLADLLIASCYFQLNPWEDWVELGHRHGVKVYPALSESRIRGETPGLQRNSPESYRARASRVWQSGADGVYLFNFFNPRAAMLREIGRPQTLAGLDKLYFATVRTTRRGGYASPDYWLTGGERFLNVPTLSPEDPLVLQPNAPVSVDLLVGDDLAAAVRQGLEPRAALHLVAAGSDSLRVRFNGSLLEQVRCEGAVREFPLAAELLRQGANRLSVEYLPRTAEHVPGQWSAEWTAAAAPAAPWSHDPPRAGRTIAQLQDGALLIADRGTASGEYLYYSYPWHAAAEPSMGEVKGEVMSGIGVSERRSHVKPTAAEVEVQVTSGWNNVIVSDGTATERLMLYPDYIGTYHSGLRYAMDTTGRFHTYRIEIAGRDLRVYVDGQLRLDATGKFTAPADGRSDFRFGAANSPSLGEALWRAVRLQAAEGVTLFDAAVSVRFPDSPSEVK